MIQLNRMQFGQERSVRPVHVADMRLSNDDDIVASAELPPQLRDGQVGFNQLRFSFTWHIVTLWHKPSNICSSKTALRLATRNS
jgi:hypothetical protein